MPHQCLGCGHAFQTGSMELLKGCPGCKGTRFFYTDMVLDDEARAAKAQQASGDLREVLQQMAREEKLDAKSLLAGKSFDDWITLAAKPKIAAAAKPTSPAAPVAPVAPAASAAPKLAPEARVESPAEPQAERSVGTVQVHEPGNYTLDVERLLAAKPIVIEKEGVYMIHLASAFEAPAEGAMPIRRKR